MAEYILSYAKYLNEDKLNEEAGWKTWLASFMLLLNLGVVPPKIAKADTQTKIEWVQSLPKNATDLGKFAGLLSRKKEIGESDIEDIKSLLDEFNINNGSALTIELISKYLKCDSYEDDNETYYKWTFSTNMNDSEVGTDIYKIKPAKYGNGISLISDYGDFMSPKFEDSLNQVLFKYERTTGVEIAVLTVPSLYGADIDEYKTNIFNKWGVGKKGNNNGILIITSMGDRKWAIATGYGMEGMAPDAYCDRWGERYLVSNFKEGNYNKGFSELIEAMKSEFGSIPLQMKKDLDAKYDKIEKEKTKEFFTNAAGVAALLLIIGLVAYLVNSSIKRRKRINSRISDIKTNLSNVDQALAKLTNNSGIFDDEKILAALKKTSEELKNSKLQKEKYLEQTEKEINNLISEINDLIKYEKNLLIMKSKAEDIMSKLSNTSNEPTEMQRVAKEALNTLNTLNFSKLEISDESAEKYSMLMDRVLSYYKKYKDYGEKLSSIKLGVGEFDKTKQGLIDKLEKAKTYVDKVEKLGYTTTLPVSVENINSLRSYIDQVSSIFMSDLPRAINLMNEYDNKTTSLSNDIGTPIRKFNDIVQAQTFIKENDPTYYNILKKITEYKRYGYLNSSDITNAESLISSYEEYKKTTSNVLNLSSKLSDLIEKLNTISKKGRNNREEEERRKREEEEEERRRRRRREEEEERSRRSSYSSSSSSSFGGGGSSFGGFGGGSSGGGGASGSW